MTRTLRLAPRAALAAGLVIALAGWEPFRTADPDVEAGNRAYADGRYADALAAYDRAARRGAVDRDGLAFDRGTAELKQADAARDPAEKQRLTERALEDLKQASHARDPRIRGSAHYNRGNLLMAEGKLDDAVEAYKQALREAPGLDDARYNLELALRRRHSRRSPPQPGRPGQNAQPGQGQGGPGQPGQGAQAPGQPGQGGPGAPGAGSPGAPPPGNASGSGAPPPDGGSGGGTPPPSGGNGGGSAPGGAGGASGGPSGSGSDPRATPPPGANPGDGRSPPRGRPPRGSGPRSPRTPTDGKLDDLDNFSRRLQKDEARRRATGRAADPDHDW